MVSPSIATGSSTGPIVFELDTNFNISDVKAVGVAPAHQPPRNLRNLHFLSLIPPEARGAADDFFARLLAEQVCSTNQLFLQYPDKKSVPVDLLCRKIADSGRRMWEVVVWNRECSSQTERELMLLYAVSSRINQSTDEFAFAEDVLFQIHNMMDVDASSLLHLQQGRMQVTASRGLSDASLAMMKNLPDWQVDLYLPLDSVDPLALMPAGATEVADSICEASGCKPWLVVPVRTSMKFYGILGVARKSNEPFSERERYLLMSLGRNLANASEKGRLFRGIKERNHRLSRSRRELRGSLVRLERAHRELQHLDEMKKSFISLASHELQTPMTSIIGNAELLKRDFAKLPERSQESLAEMLGGVDDLRARIEALLAANRVGSGLFAPRFNHCTVQQIFSELEPEVTEIAVDRILNLWRHEGTDCLDILLDIELVKQALRLQLDNAIRHTPAGGEITLGCVECSADQLQQQSAQLRGFYPDVEERLGCFEDYVLMTVEDNGDGIDDSEKMKIFAPFYGGGLAHHHSSRGFNYTGKGFGLGLSLAKRIIEAHNGLLWVEDRDGGGSRFCQLLPQVA
jgi:signal transduction histidine kinase